MNAHLTGSCAARQSERWPPCSPTPYHPFRRPGTAHLNTLFISDLHLDPASPGIQRQFLGFLEGEARSADALYILGDLFEVWLGDDDPAPSSARS